MQYNNIFKTWPLIIAFTLGALGAHADEIQGSSTSEKASELVPPVKQTPGEVNVDDLITNNNLRALTGSTSKWSLSSSFTFNGGTIGQPFAEGRPNIAGASATSTDTDLNGQLNIKYNINQIHSLLVGFGIRKMAPFAKNGPSAEFFDQGGKDVDAFDPSLTYQYIYKIGTVQSVATATYVQYTRQDISSAEGGNLSRGLNFDQENILEIGNTGLSIGGSIGFSGNAPTDSNGQYSRYQYWFSPYLEYQVSEKINLRTVSNLWNYEFYTQSDNQVSEGWNHDAVTQSVGVGFSISRDLFLYPNIQFNPEHIVAGITNVGVTATINMF